MKKRTLLLAPLAVTLPLVLSSSALLGQSGGAGTKIGPVGLSWTLPGVFADNRLTLRGSVHMTATDYDLQAGSLVVLLSRAGGGPGIAKATALGDPAKGTQVVGRFEAAAQDRTYLINGDRAVYAPEAGRKGGGRIDFTGHVLVTIKSPKDLSGPGVMSTDRATVFVGTGVDYPKVEFGPGTLNFTPLPQGK